MNSQRRKMRPARRRFSAADKCRAVLSLWTERRSLAELCRELGVTWNVLSQWQEQAMEGMLQGLTPKCPGPCGQMPLSSRLQSLLERKSLRPAPSDSPPPKPADSPAPPRRTPPTVRTPQPPAATPGEAPGRKTPAPA